MRRKVCLNCANETLNGAPYCLRCGREIGRRRQRAAEERRLRYVPATQRDSGEKVEVGAAFTPN